MSAVGFENGKPAHIIRMYCNSGLFFASVCELKPPHKDNERKFYESFTKSMERFSVDNTKIITISSVEDAVRYLFNVESDPFVWFVVALSFMHYYFGDCSHNLMFGHNQKTILKIAIQYVKENVIKDAYPYSIYLDGDIINEKGEKLDEKESQKYKKKDLADIIGKEKLSQVTKHKGINVTEVLHAMNMLYYLPDEEIDKKK